MSKVVIQGNASGTGNFTIAAPNSDTDRTLTLPDSAGEFVTTEGANFTGIVGIGTTAPSTGYGGTISNVKLALKGEGAGGNNGTATLLMGGDNNHYSYLSSEHTGGGATYLSLGTAGGASNPVERVRITSTGTLAVNTTGSPYKIDVLDDTYVAYFHHSNGVGVFLTGGSNSWSAASDETLKENITELNKDDSYNNIKNIRAVTYKYIIDSDETSRLGFIAQDWQPNYPQSITTDQNDKLGLNYTDTIPVLLSALQKAQEKIEALEARVTALENA